ncbi:carbon storage regulator CsrA [Austwickia chelonae]|uniref:carbon storage regulator CsrA n=1 Tax=Austwickia chelonae TaxID=100225 RepID=UPI000E25BE43|nr:carbon storage regulator CsrA [Austwickia chelonae]
MLVLSRRPQQSLLIGNDVVVTVLEVNGDTVRIGISAPPEIDIHREEVYLDLKRSNAEAATSPGAAATLSRRMRPREGGAERSDPATRESREHRRGHPRNSGSNENTGGKTPAKEQSSEAPVTPARSVPRDLASIRPGVARPAPPPSRR